jgi:hypothetical protein
MANLTAAATPATAFSGVTSAYSFTLTAAQIFSFADLVRRLAQAYGPDASRRLNQDYVDALFAFLALTPEPGDEEVPAYCRALDLGLVPNWFADGQPLFCTTGEWAAQVSACRHDGPAAWPGLALAGAAAYAMTLTAKQIFDFTSLVFRLGIQACRQDTDSGVRLRHDLWEALQGFTDLLPQPSACGLDGYVAALRAGEVADWAGDGRPLTESAGKRAVCGRGAKEAETGGVTQVATARR